MGNLQKKLNMQSDLAREQTVNDIKFSEEDLRSMMIWDMEKILNPGWFWRRLNKTDQFATLSTAQYWDWLTYIDDDYLTEWEVVKMKELYLKAHQDLSGEFCAHFIMGFALTYPLMGP